MPLNMRFTREQWAQLIQTGLEALAIDSLSDAVHRGIDGMEPGDIADVVMAGLEASTDAAAATFTHRGLDNLAAADLAGPVHSGLDAMAAADLAGPVLAGFNELTAADIADAVVAAINTQTREVYLSAGAGYTSQGILSSLSDETPAWLLPNTVTDAVHWQFVIPTDWPAGSITSVRVTCTSVTSGSDNFYLTGAVRCVAEGQDIITGGATDSDVVILSEPTSSWDRTDADFSVSVVADPGDLVKFSITRSGGNPSDTSPFDLYALDVVVTFTPT